MTGLHGLFISSAVPAKLLYHLYCAFFTKVVLLFGIFHFFKMHIFCCLVNFLLQESRLLREEGGDFS